MHPTPTALHLLEHKIHQNLQISLIEQSGVSGQTLQQQQVREDTLGRRGIQREQQQLGEEAAAGVVQDYVEQLFAQGGGRGRGQVGQEVEQVRGGGLVGQFVQDLEGGDEELGEVGWL
jgi:hypothetical protein